MSAPERREWFDAHTAGGRHRLVVAVDSKERVLGWAATSPFRPRAAYATTVESSVYCRPECRGVGLGPALYRHLFESIANEDIERIVAGVTLPNPASIALHERFGFRPVGTFSSVGRKFGRYWDTLWFERPRLLPSPEGLAERMLTGTLPPPPDHHDTAPGALRRLRSHLRDLLPPPERPRARACPHDGGSPLPRLAATCSLASRTDRPRTTV